MRYKLTLKGSLPELKAKMKVMFPTLPVDDIEEVEASKSILVDRLRSHLKKTSQEITRILNRI